jgi:hypothetical protein
MQLFTRRILCLHRRQPSQPFDGDVYLHHVWLFAPRHVPPSIPSHAVGRLWNGDGCTALTSLICESKRIVAAEGMRASIDSCVYAPGRPR